MWYRTRIAGVQQGIGARSDLTLWISPTLAWHGVEGRVWAGRRQVFTDAAMLAREVLFQMPEGGPGHGGEPDP